MYLGFVHHARRLGDQQRQQIEGLPCQVNRRAVLSNDLPRRRIKHQRAESDDHTHSPWPLLVTTMGEPCHQLGSCRQRDLSRNGPHTKGRRGTDPNL